MRPSAPNQRQLGCGTRLEFSRRVSTFDTRDLGIKSRGFDHHMVCFWLDLVKGYPSIMIIKISTLSELVIKVWFLKLCFTSYKECHMLFFIINSRFLRLWFTSKKSVPQLLSHRRQPLGGIKLSPCVKTCLTRKWFQYVPVSSGYLRKLWKMDEKKLPMDRWFTCDFP